MPPSTRMLNERQVLEDRRLFQVAQVFQTGSTVESNQPNPNYMWFLRSQLSVSAVIRTWLVNARYSSLW